MMREVKSSRSRGEPAERGIALIGVVGLLLVFLVFAGALMTQLANEMNSTKMSAVSNRALSAADAGVHAMVEQIQTNLALNQALPKVVTYAYPEPGASPLTTSYNATLDQVIPAGGLNYYVITSTGTYSNGIESTITRTVRAVAKAIPISDFASFSNYESNQFGNPVWYLSSQHFNGPVYSGGPMRIAYATPAPSPSPTIVPIFGSTVQTGNTPIWNPASPGPSDWADIISGGQSAFTINGTPLSLPQPSENIYVASEAWQGNGLNPGFPSTTPGVYIDGASSGGADAANSTVPTDTTGIFIETGTKGGYNGSATIVSTVSGNTDTMTITSPAWAGAYTVTINYSNFGSAGDCTGSTTVTHGSAAHTFAGTPCGAPGPGVTNTGNGAIFADGNIQLGCTASKLACGTTPTADTTFEGDYALVTPDLSSWPNTANNITILGNLLYDPSTSLYDKTGLWANDVVLKTNTTAGITIDAGIIAGYPGEASSDGDFNNAHCTKKSCGTLDQGVLTINGSLVENIRGAVGEVIAGSQFGFARTINFDSRFATAPPPFNPTTGQLSIVAWEDIGA